MRINRLRNASICDARLMAHKYFNPFQEDDSDDGEASDSVDSKDAVTSDEEDEDEVSVEEDEEDSEEATSDPSSDPSSSSSDPTLRIHYRHRVELGLVRHQARTLAAEAGFRDADDLRFKVTLKRQHEQRIADKAFCGLQEPVPGKFASVNRWRAWRKGFLEHFGLSTYRKTEVIEITRVAAPPAPPADPLPVAPPPVAAREPHPAVGKDAPAPGKPVTTRITVYKYLVSFVVNICLLLHLFFAFAPLPPDPVTPVLLCGDGVGEAAPGCPGRGKVFGLYIKVLGLYAPQSPRWLIPILFSFGSDAAGVLRDVFASTRMVALVEMLERRRFGRPGRVTSLALAFLGDFPACNAMLHLATPARPLPTTAGRLPLWRSVMCWHCCGGAPELYSSPEQAHAYRINMPEQNRRRVGIRTSLGIPAARVFYELAHAVTVLVQSVLCDIAIYYQRIHTNYLHPVSAWIQLIFPSATWDIFLVRPHIKRTSHKPFYCNDPAVVWAFVVDDALTGLLDRILELHDVQWRPVPDTDASSPRLLWRWFMRFIRALIIGDAADARLAGTRAEDMWLRMLSLSAPVTVACVSTPPAFCASITAFGPASHLAFCSTPRYIEFVNRALPRWRESGQTFARIASGIFLEHGMKGLRADYMDWGVASQKKAQRPMELLERSIERVLLWIILERPTLPSAPPAQRADVAELADARGAAAESTNRAYVDIPLSRIPALLVCP